MSAPAEPRPPQRGDGRIVARGISRRFGARVAVEPLDIEVAPGAVTGLLGPNGSGKSTLLRMLTGLVRPDAGRAWIDGVPVRGDGTAARRRCTYAPGELALYPEPRGAEHLAWLLRGREREALPRARRLAEELGLPLRARVRTYSHGMKRQLLFAAALAPRVPARILDEAGEGLDPSKRSVLLDLLAEDARAGTAILLSSHHLGEVDRVCGRFVFLNAGRVVSREDAGALARRAATLLHVTFALGAQGASLSPALPPYEPARDGLERRLLALGASSVRLAGARATVELPAPDPRPFLAALGAARDLPPVARLEYGEVSLAELYRDLYGVEAV